MDRSKDLEEKTRKISAKIGVLFVKELLTKQYKMNYLQKLKAKSQAFNIWKQVYIKNAEEKKGMCYQDAPFSYASLIKIYSREIFSSKIPIRFSLNFILKVVFAYIFMLK